MNKVTKILVPTDYSEFAKRAAIFAINLANHFGSEVLLYHLFQVPSSTGSFASMRDVIGKDALDDMAKLEKELLPLVKGSGSLKTAVAENHTVEAIVNRAKKEDFDLIVMGTQGASGLTEIFIGSIAASVLKRAETPLLAIPEHANFEALRTVVLALDNEGIQGEQNFELLHALVKSFGAKLKIIHVETGDGDLELASQVKFFFEGLDYEYLSLPIGGSINETINQYIAAQEADLLCMLRRKKSFFQRIFEGSSTTKEVFNSEVPLLVMKAS
ncbi:MAG: universal stress protein [Bacteroidota bacterium]